jgi:hypothetical protein
MKKWRVKLEAAYLRHLTYRGAKGKYGDPVPDDVATRSILNWKPSKPWVSRIFSDYCRISSMLPGRWAFLWARAVVRQQVLLLLLHWNYQY